MKIEIEVLPREKYDVVLFKMPNGNTIRMQTTPAGDSIEITHNYDTDGTMYIKPMTGNQFEIKVI